MSALGSWLWGTSQIDEAVEKATSELIPSGSEDMALNLEICDQIRSKSAPAKEAMRALKSRLNHKNPNVQLLALSLTDVCIKNGGDHFLVEIASREFMDNLVSILKMPSLNSDVKQTILRLIQNWGNAFSSNPALSYVTTTYKSLQHEGFNFPPLDYANANAALIDTRTAPEWIDSDVCLRCRDPFTFTNRKHHCRNCGQVFDQKCSSKTMALPHFGIVQSVRVCDACYNKQHKHHDKIHRHTKSLGPHGHRTARELEDRELQRAIQLSLEEVGAAGSWRPGYVPTQPSAMPWQRSEPPIVERNTDVAVDEEDDPDLKAAIEASLREATAPKPSAPIATPGSEAPVQHNPTGLSQSYPPSTVRLPNIPNYDLEPLEEDAILTFSQTIEQVQTQGAGRELGLGRFPGVNELYDKATGLRGKLATNLEDVGRKEELLTEMHDKLSQAVKLYDQLLTQQVSQPRWRSQQSYTPQQYQTTVPASQNQQPASTSSQPIVSAPSPYQSPSQPVAAQYQPASYQQSVPAPATQYQASPSYPLPEQQYTAPAPPSLPHVTYNPNPSFPAPPPPPSGSPALSRQTTISSSPTQSIAPDPVRSNSLPSQSLYVQPQSYQAPTSLSIPSAAQLPDVSTTRAPTVLAQSPPPPHAFQQSPQPYQQQQQYIPPQFQRQAPAPVTMPLFPIAPTSVPPVQFPHAPTQQPASLPPQKEAMLIDL